MSELKVNSVVDAAGGNTVTVNGYTPTMSNMAGRNRIINGDMRIDQRNAGASVTYGSGTNPGNYYGYNIDRWWAQSYSTVAGNGATFTVQRSSDVPANFNNSLVATVTTAQPTLQNDSLYRLQHMIEGYNSADFGFGTSSPSDVTLSFWVKSNVTGTFTGVVSSESAPAAYPYIYTITTANTWQKVAITIPGATIGTWNTTNGTGIIIAWCLGAYSTRLGTANTWTSNAGLQGATGQVNFMGTVGNTFYITGVQLEAGSVATPFEHRQYGQELALCQRYYYSLPSGRPSSNLIISVGYQGASNNAWLSIPLPVKMRAAPTITSGGWAGSNPNISSGSQDFIAFNFVSSGAYFDNISYLTASAEL